MSSSSATHGGQLSRGRFADQSAVRGHNLEAVARLVRTSGGCTRRQISEALGFNKATVSSLVKDLIAAQLLEDGEVRLGQNPGRPSTLVRMERATHVSVVVEILPDSLVISTWNLAGDRLWATVHAVHPAADGPRSTLVRIARVLRPLVRKLEAEDRRLGGVVVAVPGMVDTGLGQLIVSGPLSWSDVPIREILASKLACDAMLIDVEKIANLATMAEWRRLDGCSDLVYLDEGSAGLGVGAVVAGRLLTGHRGRAGELLFPPRDHLASRVSLRELGLHRLLDASADEPLGKPQASGSFALDAAGRAAVNKLAKTMTEYLATLAALLDPEVVVLGGQFSALEPHIAAAVQRSLAQALAPVSQQQIELRFGVYGRQAAQVGGGVLVADRVVDRLLAAARLQP